MDPAQMTQQSARELFWIIFCLLVGAVVAIPAAWYALRPVLQALRDYRRFGREHKKFIDVLATKWQCSPEYAQKKWEEFAELSDKLPEAVKLARETEKGLRDLQRLDELERATRKLESEKWLERLADACRTADLRLWADVAAQTCPDQIRGTVWGPVRQFISVANAILLDGDLAEVYVEEVGRQFDARIAAVARQAAPGNEQVETWIAMTRRKLLAVVRDWQHLVTRGGN